MPQRDCEIVLHGCRQVPIRLVGPIAIEFVRPLFPITHAPPCARWLLRSHQHRDISCRSGHMLKGEQRPNGDLLSTGVNFLNKRRCRRPTTAAAGGPRDVSGTQF